MALLSALAGHALQWRVMSDSGKANPIQSASLVADLRQQEVRTRAPVPLSGVPWPGMVNPIEFRVIGEQGVPLAPWQPLGKSVITLPDLKKWSCSADGQSWLVSGERLELIQAAGWMGPESQDQSLLPQALFRPCPDGLCLTVDRPVEGQRLAIQLHWLGERRFSLQPVMAPVCPQLQP